MLDALPRDLPTGSPATSMAAVETTSDAIAVITLPPRGRVGRRKASAWDHARPAGLLARTAAGSAAASEGTNPSVRCAVSATISPVSAKTVSIAMPPPRDRQGTPMPLPCNRARHQKPVLLPRTVARGARLAIQPLVTV